MGIIANKETVVEPGIYNGEIVDAQINTKTFNEEEGPKEVLDVQILPDHPDENVHTLLQSYTPILNGLSKLSELLERLEQHPKDGEKFEPFSIVGTRVRFEAVEANSGYITYTKDSVVPEPQND